MKHIFTKTLFIVLVLNMSFGKDGQACIDYPPSIWVQCEYDTTNLPMVNELLLTVKNMYLFGSPAGAFCSCAINDLTGLYNGNITYVSFVDSGTYNPVSGFAPWTADAQAGTGWNNIQAGNWDGFLASTIGAGLLNGVAVELIIRVSLTGYTLSAVDSSLVFGELGTDEWDNIGDSLALSHNSIISLTSGGSPSYIGEDPAFFAQVDAVLGVNHPNPSYGISVFPNPVSNMLTINLGKDGKEVEEISIINVMGQVVMQIPQHGLNLIYNIDVSSLPVASYFVKVVSAKGTFVQPILKN